MIGWIARHWPFANGAGRLVDSYGSGIDCGSRTRDVITHDGFTMSVMAGDLIGRHLIITGQFDRSLFEILLGCAMPGDHVLDVGGNIGYASCLVLHHVADSRVTTIEPQPDVAALLRRNLSRFDAHRWHVHEAALSDVDGDGHMHIDAGNRGASALADHGTAIRMIHADAFLSALDRIDLVKVDIEGHEETLFRAGRAQFERLQPRAILFEDQAHAPGPDGWIDEILQSIGYDIYGVRKSLFSTRLVAVTPSNRTDFHDYLAVSRARRGEIASLGAMMA